jgi:pimeloyl-ACP methyl ester carboxylesterase
VTTTTTEPVTTTLEVPGATLTYDVRRNGGTSDVPLFMIGQPMGAGGFPSLASRFTDRVVITYDPRGCERSVKTDPASTVTPEIQADDVHRVIGEVGGPVDLFGSSGGAITALVVAAMYPDDVRTVVAHEPPLASLVPDSEYAKAACQAIHETYEQKGWGAGMAHFIAVVSHRGPFTPDVVAQPAPDPAMFGMPAEDDGTRTDPMLGQGLLHFPPYEPDFDALRRTTARVVLAAGEESEGEMAHRGAEAVAERLGTEVVMFPSDHGGFLGGEYGQTGKPAEFAAKLREILAAS